MKHFRITFKTKSKYHSQTRTVEVETISETQAKILVYEQFGSFTWTMIDKAKIQVPSDKIEIISCVEIDNEGNVIAEEPPKKTRTPRRKKEVIAN